MEIRFKHVNGHGECLFPPWSAVWLRACNTIVNIIVVNLLDDYYGCKILKRLHCTTQILIVLSKFILSLKRNKRGNVFSNKYDATKISKSFSQISNARAESTGIDLTKNPKLFY